MPARGDEALCGLHHAGTIFGLAAPELAQPPPSWIPLPWRPLTSPRRTPAARGTIPRMLRSSLLALALAGCVLGCDDAGPAVDPPDQAAPVSDAGFDAVPDASPDAQPDAAASHDAGLDAAPDARPDQAIDMQVDAYVPAAPGEAIHGEGERLPNQDSDPGMAVAFSLGERDARLTAAQIRARVWRWEDGEVQVQLDDAPPQPAIILGDADGAWRFLRARDGAAPGGLPPVLDIPPETRTLRVIAEGGPVALGQLRLADPQADEPAVEYSAPQTDATISPRPCGADCDDGAALTAALAEAPADGWLRVELSGRYRLTTPWQVQRDRVRIIGDDAVLVWDPDAEGHRAAVAVTGDGPQGPRQPIEGGVSAGQRRFVITPPADWRPRWVRIVADDFGGIHPVCSETRDQEQLNRHLSQLVTVLALSPREDGQVEVMVDRPIFLDIPPEANPGLQAVALRENVSVETLELQTNCPEALENTRFDRVACTNPAVIEDDGLLFQWTDRARAVGLTIQGTGKFAVDATHALRTRVVDLTMSHPADYGGGGKGYGVHLIRASRSVVRGAQVTQARHGVVVDFGSSDSQVLDGDFSVMNQALIDVHGEASRDTLIRGNRLRDGPLGVIVGGGGGFAHCNDGPRQHIHHNHATGITNAAVTAFFATPGVYVRANDLDATLFGVVVAFSAEALVEQNIIRRARVGVQAADAGRVVVRESVFTDACDEAAASLNANGEIVFEAGNVFCP